MASMVALVSSWYCVADILDVEKEFGGELRSFWGFLAFDSYLCCAPALKFGLAVFALHNSSRIWHCHHCVLVKD